MDSTYFRIDSPSVIYEMFDNELVAIHLDTGAYHSLTGAAADAFQWMTNAVTARELAEALARKYDESADTIEAALLPFFADLETEKLIIRLNDRAADTPIQVEAVASKLPFTAPRLQAYHDLQSLFLLDPVHEVGEQGWPQPLSSTPQTDEQAR